MKKYLTITLCDKQLKKECSISILEKNLFIKNFILMRESYIDRTNYFKRKK